MIGLYPAPMSKIFFGNSGSDANDTQVKLVWYYNNVLGRPEKKKIISRHRGYHGVTVMAAGLTGLASPARRLRPAAADDPAHDAPPHRLWEADPGTSDEEFAQKLADELEQLIVAEGPETIAAFIGEPLQGAGGVIVPPDDLLGPHPGGAARVRRPADLPTRWSPASAGSGSWFGAEVFGIEPDLVTVAKGITSAYVPLSGCLVSEKVWSVLVEGSARLGPFGARLHLHRAPARSRGGAREPRRARERRAVAQSAARGTHLHRRLREAFDDHPLVGEVRGRGLIAARRVRGRARSADALRPRP